MPSGQYTYKSAIPADKARVLVGDTEYVNVAVAIRLSHKDIRERLGKNFDTASLYNYARSALADTKPLNLGGKLAFYPKSKVDAVIDSYIEKHKKPAESPADILKKKLDANPDLAQMLLELVS